MRAGLAAAVGMFLALWSPGGAVIAVVPGQDGCRAPLPAPSREANIFTPAQENEFGDALAERFEPYLTILEDEALTAPLREIGTRLVARMPPDSPRVQFKLIDSPETTAFVLPGGRVYVTRKLIGLTRSEDELAGVLAHELGHVVARQVPLALTRQLREVIGVTSVGDRADMLRHYDRLMDNAARKPKLFRTDSHESAQQLEADRIGLFITAAAGYDPNAHATFFDRLAGTRGDTGGFFSRFFGTTNPDARRLREIQRRAAALPPGCGERVAAAPDRYRAWQLAVARADVTGGAESLPGLLSRTPLGAFRDQARHVRFSPDGRHVLAQDDTGITVMDREPMAVRFRIPVTAEPAAFSPDSQSVILHTPDLRVERWSVKTQAPTDVRDVYWPIPCLATALAPTGRAIACVDFDGHLTLIDVESGAQVVQRRNFYRLSGGDFMLLLMKMIGNTRFSGDLSVQFSPSGRFLAAGYAGFEDSGTYVYDLEQQAVVNLRDPAKRLVGGTFAFLPGDRLIGLNAREPQKSGVLQLPGGDVIQPLSLPAAALEGTADPRFAIVRPHQKFAMGLLDVTAGSVITGLDTLAVDVFDGHYATERGVSHLGVYAIAGARLQTSAELPATRLPAARTGSVSSDLRWLALSASGRGAMWDLSKGERLAYFRDFDGSFVDGGGVLFADMPDAGGERRAVARYDPGTRALTSLGEIAAEYARQYGPWLLLRRHELMFTQAPAVEYRVRDVRTSVPGWAVKFDRNGPDDYWFHPQSDALALIWTANSPGGRDRLRQDPELRKSIDMGDLAGDYVIEVMDAATGKLRGRRVLETGRGSFRLLGVLAKRDRLIVSDSLNRVLVYSLATGELKGYVFGDNPMISDNGRRIAVSTGKGRVAVFDLDTLQRLADFRFRDEVPFAALNADGTRLLAVTADQQAIVIEIK